MFILFWHHYWRGLLHYFRTRRTAKIITISLFGLVFTAVGIGIFLFFREGLSYIKADSYFGQALSYFVYEMYLIIFIALVVMSALINGIFRWFKRGHDSWLMGSPRFDLLPKHVFVTVCLESLWPFLVIVIPLVFALDRVFPVSGSGAALIAIGAICLVVFMAGSTMFLLAGSGTVLRLLALKWPRFRLSLRKLAFLVMVIMGLALWFVWRHSIDADLVRMFHAQDLARGSAGLDMIRDNFLVFPSHFLASALFSWQSGNSLLMLMYVAALLFLAAAVTVAWWIVSPWLLPLWVEMQAGTAVPTGGKTAVRTAHGVNFTFRGGLGRALFGKEAIVFFRNTRGIMWFLFLVVIWLIQAAVNLTVSRNTKAYELEFATLPAIIQIMQYLTAVYFVSAFVLRFALPSFSAERRTAWLLASAPVNWRRVYLAKLAFFSLAFVAIGMVIGYANIAILDIPTGTAMISYITFLGAILFITTLGLSLGLMFPNFDTDDPSALGTSLCGLGFIFGSLVYGAIGAGVLLFTFSGAAYWPVIGFWAVTAGLILLLIKIAPQRLERIDFVRNLG